MDVKALIVEQLDLDGTLRTFKMEPGYGRRLVVAFADEYDEPRSGPFHFLDQRYSQEYVQGFATAQIRRVAKRRFYMQNDFYHFNTSWAGIPTMRNHLTYYALSLPSHAIPQDIRIIDPHSGGQYRKNVSRDDLRNRFIIYLECRSSKGIFDFILETEFRIKPTEFPNAEYYDAFCSPYGHQIDSYQWHLEPNERTLVQQFFTGGINKMGDTYNVGQAGAVGPNAHAHDMTFNQIGGQIEASMDLSELAQQLSRLRQTMSQEATEAEHHIAVGEIAKAEKAAKEKDASKVAESLKSAGKWALEVASKIGVSLAIDAIKQATGLR